MQPVNLLSLFLLLGITQSVSLAAQDLPPDPLAAQALALSAAELRTNPALLREANRELQQRRGDGFSYESLLGDREPPLDYRN
jgi:hypothetical protein